MSNPPAAASKMIGEMETLLTVPEGAGPALEDKAEALAGAWMTRGVMMLGEFKAAGEKLGGRNSRSDQCRLKTVSPVAPSVLLPRLLPTGRPFCVSCLLRAPHHSKYSSP